MLLEALQIVETSLGTYLAQRLKNNLKMVTLGNVAMAEQLENDLKDKMIISMVNIEEESSLKNARYVRSSALTGETRYHNAPVSLNLYLLFSANFNSYENALRMLSLVIEFFQGQRTFTSAPSANTDRLSSRAELSFNLYTMTFEQLNHLWGALGGKQLPSALYRVSLVQIEDEVAQEGGGIITEVTLNENLY